MYDKVLYLDKLHKVAFIDTIKEANPGARRCGITTYRSVSLVNALMLPENKRAVAVGPDHRRLRNVQITIEQLLMGYNIDINNVTGWKMDTDIGAILFEKNMPQRLKAHNNKTTFFVYFDCIPKGLYKKIHADKR